jgi:hypothetical protein
VACNRLDCDGDTIQNRRARQSGRRCSIPSQHLFPLLNDRFGPWNLGRCFREGSQRNLPRGNCWGSDSRFGLRDPGDNSLRPWSDSVCHQHHNPLLGYRLGWLGTQVDRHSTPNETIPIFFYNDTFVLTALSLVSPNDPTKEFSCLVSDGSVDAVGR